MKKLDHLTSSYYFPENILFLVQIQLLREHKEKKVQCLHVCHPGGFYQYDQSFVQFFWLLSYQFWLHLKIISLLSFYFRFVLARLIFICLSFYFAFFLSFNLTAHLRATSDIDFQNINIYSSFFSGIQTELESDFA